MGWFFLYGWIVLMGLYFFGGSFGGWKVCGVLVLSVDLLKFIGKYKWMFVVDWF